MRYDGAVLILKRAWLALSVLWLLPWVLGMQRTPATGEAWFLFFALAFFPFYTGFAIVCLLRFIFTGSFRRPRVFMAGSRRYS
jgi:hypothetical protein